MRRSLILTLLCGALVRLSAVPAQAQEPGCVIGSNGFCVAVDPALAIQPISISFGRLCFLPGSCPGEG